MRCARVPASSANLGPGFDTLGLALSLYTEVTVEPAGSLVVKVEGEGSHFRADETHYAVKVVAQVLGHTRVAVSVRSEIPVSRGLGSSAALALAAAAAAGCDDPLTYVSRLEGHADNAAASVMGGLVTASIVDGTVEAHPLPLDPSLVFVVVIPDRRLATRDARAALPTVVAIEDAVFNLGRLGAVIAGLADGRRLTPTAMRDRLHQRQRTVLFPESPALLRALTDAGALASCWSGAGPTLLGVCHGSAADGVRNAAQDVMLSVGVAGSVRVLQADLVGLVVSVG